MKNDDAPPSQIPLFERPGGKNKARGQKRAETELVNPASARAPASVRDSESAPDTAAVNEAGPHVFSVTELTLLVKGVIEERFNAVWVEGEISGFRGANASGHIYFSLKDSGAVIPAVVFKRRAAALKFALRDGLQVIAKGGVEIYPPHGRYQLIVEAVEPKGEGARQLALRQLKERLEKEGLFAAERKRPIPLLPRRVGVVTSATGAAFRDIEKVIARRYPSMPILLAPATVQGDAAAVSIAQALARIDAVDDVDVIIVGRGGGAVEDLWAFNEEIVVRAIAACRHPVIAAIGHEIDVTLADLAADLRAPTPSAAAENAVPVRSELKATLDSLAGRAARAVRRAIDHERHKTLGARSRLGDPRRLLRDARLAVDDAIHRAEGATRGAIRTASRRTGDLASRLTRQHPRSALTRVAERLRSTDASLCTAIHQHLLRDRNSVAALAGRLDALSPLAVLERGYAIAQRPDGRAVRSTADVSVGDRVGIRLSKGELSCRVEGTKE
ncbi:MAG: exodeoxyribonuclease VII large subunit [Deltaproteobacteria bacterium]|nr:exodeoxyribonuclease VII large subunit [Deltaproteobacteria bacterium]